MATVKVHLRSGKAEHNGHENCDFRGDRRPTGDEHGEKQKTIFEREFGPDVQTNEFIEKVLADGPAWNRLTAELFEGMVPAKVFGVDVGDALSFAGAGDELRIGVFDE